MITGTSSRYSSHHRDRFTMRHLPPAKKGLSAIRSSPDVTMRTGLASWYKASNAATAGSIKTERYGSLAPFLIFFLLQLRDERDRCQYRARQLDHGAAGTAQARLPSTIEWPQ